MSKAPRTPYLGRYLVVLIAGIIGAAVIRILFQQVLGTNAPAGALAIIPPMIAALHVGQVWGRDRGDMPTNGEAWRFALVAGLVFLAVQMVLLPLVFLSVEPTGNLIGILVGMTVFTTLVTVLINRFFVTMGAKGTVRR